MKRFSPQHVNQVAREFASSHIAKTWSYFGPDIQNAIIDATVMQEIRMAHVADSAQTFTPTEIVEFRDAVKAKLAEGVLGRGMRCAFRVDDGMS